MKWDRSYIIYRCLYCLPVRSVRRVECYNPFRTAAPFWGQPTQISSGLSPKRGCGPKRVNIGTAAVPQQTKSDLKLELLLEASVLPFRLGLAPCHPSCRTSTRSRLQSRSSSRLIIHTRRQDGGDYAMAWSFARDTLDLARWQAHCAYI